MPTFVRGKKGYSQQKLFFDKLHLVRESAKPDKCLGQGRACFLERLRTCVRGKCYSQQTLLLGKDHFGIQSAYDLKTFPSVNYNFLERLLTFVRGKKGYSQQKLFFDKLHLVRVSAKVGICFRLVGKYFFIRTIANFR